MSVSPVGRSLFGLAAGRVLEQVVAPTLFVFLLFVVMLVAVAKTWPWQREVGGDDPGAPPPFTHLLRHLLATAAAGYLTFLVVVAVFHVLIGGGAASVIGDAASGGAFLAFVVAVPALVALGALTRRRSR